MEGQGRVLTREFLEQFLATGGSPRSSRAVDVAISRLRGKLVENDPRGGGLFQGVRQDGYRFTGQLGAVDPEETGIWWHSDHPSS
uniref:winged helix-turn-helix domain-containing protein n=1 Tax=Sphingomonas sp. GlSt437 TaxID=3389970 RepID=UPI003A89FC9E